MQRHHADEIQGFVNIGCGEDLTIDELARLIAEVIGFKGSFVYDKTKPDGTPQKLLDITRVKKLGWVPKLSLHEGLRKTYEWYQKNIQ